MFSIFKWAIGLFTGGTLDRVLDTIERRMDNEVTKEQVKAEVTKTVVNAQAQLMVGRTWWFQLFFVVPLGAWWTAVCLDSIFGFSWNVQKLPPPLDDWAAYILSALFIVDGGKALLGRFKG